MPESDKNVIQEYLAIISPSYNMQEWEQASTTIGNKLQTVLGKVLLRGTNKTIKELEKQLDDLSRRRDSINRDIAITQQKRDAIDAEIDRVRSDASLSDSDKESQLSSLRQERDALDGLLKSQKAQQTNIGSTIENVKSSLENASQQVTDFGGWITKVSVFLGIFATMLKKAWEAAQKIIDAATEVSNNFVTQDSMFVNEDVKNTMARFGVGNMQAQSMLQASSYLGIDLSDYSTLTAGQRRAFDELMTHYQQGLESIDPDKLDRFNDSVQKYQLMQAKFDMDIQLILQKILAESDVLPELLETAESFMESITNILGSKAFQTGAEILFGIINGILEFVSAPLNFIGKLFRGSDSSTTNNTTNTTNNNNVTVNTTGISSKQLALDLSMQMQNATTP